ncbi:ADP-ribosylation/crystallin J1 [Taibaiella chishuiensis]|uniref:ADP-ribosylation/crystallin J1 n=1 Tax=Taibaiella chishuiensis TaxID=1434707 RepID=A0A2P8DAR6_9BACT|nr:ADP-ribosylation/crystallin J1 [Taibaiella chishuiensis]PSK94314.1 hypothetical protein B0I18_101469 [Taibaiella chishuiensis]
MNTQTLYRPVGLKELELIADSGWTAFPPRLDWQPIFYPVLNLAYAEQIARDWNTGDAFSGYCGAVTSFDVDTGYLQQFPVENVGAEMHNELWIPAAALDQFNKQIRGGIRVVNAFFGSAFTLPQNETIRNTLLNFIP